MLSGGKHRRVQDEVAPPALAPVPASDVVYPLRPPLPLPDGLTEDDLRRIMRSFSIDGSPRGALDGYVADSIDRFVYTYGLTEGLEGTALELGANPYFMSYLLGVGPLPAQGTLHDISSFQPWRYSTPDGNDGPNRTNSRGRMSAAHATNGGVAKSANSLDLL